MAVDAYEVDPEGVLDGFLGELHELLGSIRNEAGLIPADLRNELEAAFGEIGDHVAAARAALHQAGIRERLRTIGLTGNQLRLKIAGWRRAVGRFWGQRTARFGRIAIAWAAVVLGSLGTVVPVVEVVREFTEALDAALND